jgi:hypothetical protein
VSAHWIVRSASFAARSVRRWRSVSWQSAFAAAAQRAFVRKAPSSAFAAPLRSAPRRASVRLSSRLAFSASRPRRTLAGQSSGCCGRSVRNGMLF